MGRNRIRAVVDLEDRLSNKLGKVARSVRGFRTETDAGARATSKWGGQLDKWATKVHTFFGNKTKSLVRGWFMSMKVSAAIGMAGVSVAIGKAFRDYVEFESTLRNTTGLLAGSGMGAAGIEKAFNQFRDDIYRIAPKLAKAPQELAATLYDIVSGGFSGRDATTVLEAATKGASAGVTDPAVVGNALVKTLSAYGYGAEQATQITDKMFQSVNLGIISFEELAQQIGDVVGLAATAKVPFEDLMAAIAVMTRKGLVPAEAFTSLNQMMLSILAPGGPEAEAAAAIFGDKASEIWSGKGLAKNGLAGTVAELMKKLDPSPDQIKRMNSLNAEVADIATAEVAGDKLDVLTSLFGNVRALRGALVLASKDGYTFADAQKDMADSAGATDKVLGEQRKTVKFQLDQLKSYASVFGLQVMSDIAPAIGQKTKEVSAFFDDVLQSADYKKAKGVQKVQVLAGAIWAEVGGWWEKNKATVSKKMSEGIDWLAGTVVPFAADIGFQIGQALVPAIWKGLMNTAPGRGLVAALALSWGNKLGGGMAGPVAQGVGRGAAAGGAAGGAGGAAGATTAWFGPGGKINMAAGAAIAVTGAVMSVNELRMTYNRVVKDVEEAQGKAKTHLAGMNSEQLSEAEGRAKKWDMGRFATEIWGLLPGRTTPLEDVHAAQRRNRELTTANTINDYAKNGLIPALEKLWGGPERAGGADAYKRLLKDVLRGKDETAFLNKDDVTASAFRTGEVAKLGNMSDLLRRYTEDPEKLSESQRKAVEFLITNTKGTVAATADSAEMLLGLGGTQQEFADALAISNPLLADVSSKTSEWALQLIATRDQLDRANRYLEEHGITFGSPFGQMPGTSDFNPAVVPPTRNPDIGPGSVPGATVPNRGPRPNDPIPQFTPPRQVVPPTRVQKNALGSRGIVRKPTLFLAGENGAEDFSFTPHFKGGVDGGGSGKREVNINAPLVGEITVASEGKSVAEIADELATLVLEHLENGA